MILALTTLLVTVLLRAISQFGNVVRSAFPPCSRSTRSRSLIDCISVGVDRMQRNFEPMRRQVETWQRSELTDVTAKVVICEAFIGDGLGAPKHLTRSVHDLYFEPKYEEFSPRAPLLRASSSGRVHHWLAARSP